MDQPLIEFREIHKSFGETKVLDGVNLSVYPGSVMVVIGKSGEGKSVLLKHMIGLLKPDSGQVLIKGKDIWAMKTAERKKVLSRFSYLFQGAALFDSMTVFENISLPLRERTRLKPDEVRARVDKAVKIMDLPDIYDKYPSQLSGGMNKRVALARALVTEPDTLLFDEPTTGLDPIRKTAVLNMVSEYQAKLGFTGVLVSHAIPDVLFISQRVAFLDKGKVIYQGRPEELVKVSDPVVMQFFQGVQDTCSSPFWEQMPRPHGEAAPGRVTGLKEFL